MEDLYLIVGIVIITLLCLFLIIYFLWRSDSPLFRRKPKDLPDAKKADKPLGAARRMALMNGYQVISPACLAKDG